MRRSLDDVVRLTQGRRLCKAVQGHLRRAAHDSLQGLRYRAGELQVAPRGAAEGRLYVGIATHDEFLVWHALRLIHQIEVPKDRYEFQMLLGRGRGAEGDTRRGRAQAQGLRALRGGLVRVLEQAPQGEPEDSRLRREGRLRQRCEQDKEIGDESGTDTVQERAVPRLVGRERT